jgi:hypothetical protein
MINVYPGVPGLPDECPVATPGITIQLFEGRDDVGSNGIQMNIADESKDVVVFIAEDGLVAVFKEMPGAPVLAVEVLRIPRESVRMTVEMPSLPLLNSIWSECS